MTEEFETMAKEWRDRMLDDWGSVAKTMVGSDSFAAASAATMDWSLLWQKQSRSQMGQWLEAMEIPKRSDVARVAKQVMGVEQRVADCEDRLDELNATMKNVAKQLEKLASRIDEQPVDGAALAMLATQLEEVNRRMAEQVPSGTPERSAPERQQPAKAAPMATAAPKVKTAPKAKAARTRKPRSK